LADIRHSYTARYQLPGGETRLNNSRFNQHLRVLNYMLQRRNRAWDRLRYDATWHSRRPES